MLFITFCASAFGATSLRATPPRVQICPTLPSGTSEPDGTTQFALSVTPKGNPLTAPPDTNGKWISFTVTNNGTCTDSVNATASATGPITAVSVSPSYFGLVPGDNMTVWVSYNTSHQGSGTLTLSAVGMGNTDSGSYNVTVLFVVSTRPTNGDYLDVSKCVANCFDAVTTYSTSPYFSSDNPHSVQLLYRSAQAHPMGVVQVDVFDTSSVDTVKTSVQLKRPDGTNVTFTNGSSELFYKWAPHPADGNVNRLAAQFDASTLGTGAYTYTAVVRSYRSNGTFAERDVPVRILIVNEANSPFGAGWSIVGVQRLYRQSNGDVVITEGSGSIAYFTRTTTSCQGICRISYASPKGDFTTLLSDSAGPGWHVYCPLPTETGVCTSRTYPDLSKLLFAPAAGLAVVAYDRFGNPTSFGYNGSNRLVAVTDPTGKTDSLRYDASSHLRAIKDPGGRVDSIAIDGSGNVSKIKDWARDSVTFQYDANHRLVRSTDRRGGAWGLAYDFAGKLAADTAPQVTANGQNVRPVTGYTSSEQKVLINPATGQGTSSNPGPNVDTAAVRATVTNPRGYATTYASDRFGAATLVQEPLGRTTSFTRDSNSAVVRTVAPSGHVTKYTWTGPDLTQYQDSTTSRTISYGYDAAHHDTSVAGDADSVVNHWTNNHLDSTRTGGAGWTKFKYESDGRLCHVADPGGHTEQCYFTSTSGFRNTDSISYTLGTVGYRYDGHGQQVMTIDPVKDTTRTVYDSIGRVVMTIGPLHDTTRYFYDDSLYLTRVQDTKGQVYQAWPNALGWADSTKDPAGNLDHYRYDLNGNRISWTNRNGRTITYTYDALDQPSTILADGKTTTFFSDPAGHYVVASNNEGTDTLRFDAGDRPSLAISCRVLASGNGPQCFRDSSTYEKRDLRTRAALTAPGIWGATQFLVGQHYDVHMLLDTLTPGHLDTQTGQPIAFRYSAEALDSIRTLTGLNNLTMTHSFPWTHRTDQVQLSDPTLAAALGTAYYFDNAGRMATRYHGSLSSPDTTRSFTYDRGSELTQYTDSTHHYTTSCTFVFGGYYCTTSDQRSLIGSTSYSYDSVGNRKDPAAPNGGLDSANRLRRWQTYRMDYDAAGNMTAKRTLSPTDTTKVLRRDSLFWSALGRLDSVRTRDSLGTLTGRVGFGYDGWGRRVRKSTANGTSRYLWDGDALLAELDTLGNRVAGYTYYPGTDNIASVLRHDRGDSTYYYAQDYSRNVLGLLARTGAGVTIDNQYRYDPFGNLQGSTNSTIPNALRFAGREYDAETQLYYDRARYIDPALGRFVSEDPIGLDGGINLYAFVGNDPVNGWDPSGTKCSDWTLHQEKARDKLAHLAFGAGAVWFIQSQFEDWPRWTTIAAGAVLGLIHEGPWGKMGAQFPRDIFHGAFGDHDLWGWSNGAKGAPCAGIFDTFFFMLPGIWYTLHLWPYHFSALPEGGRVPQDLVGGDDPFPNSFPPRIPNMMPVLPPTFIPNGYPPGWVFF
jgi:RHS repeat-associated protein